MIATGESPARRVVLRLARPRLSLRVDVRLAVACAIASAVVAAGFIANLAWGEFPISPLDAVAALVGAGPPGSEFVVLDLRLPRALVAGLAGAGLALSGAVFQTMVRNPLASPDIIGISSGASVGGVAVFLTGADTALVPLAAFAGAMVASALLYLLAWRGGLSSTRLVLVGIGLAAFGFAVTSYMLVRGRIEAVHEATLWTVGSVNGRTFSDVWPLVIGLAALTPALLALGRSLDALALGEDAARALGVRVERARLALVLVGGALVALAVAAAGPIAFVALIAPNVARRLVHSTGAAIMPLAALCGAALVLLADFAARFVLAPTELPVGIVTAILGAPFFLYLLYRGNRIRTIA